MTYDKNIFRLKGGRGVVGLEISVAVNGRRSSGDDTEVAGVET